ncbi:MAG: immunoglobulin domain-containing protein [Luteolibacter sp.]|uniref:Ig-like domain-containing protein n=1 Tax=Luteolibacter sp. TaxID=1962973 RepID=UPI003266EDA6
MSAIQSGISLLAAAILLNLTAPRAVAYSSLYAFGDGVCTTTDNNPPPALAPYYYGNRYCNGPVFIEDLADSQGLTYVASRNKSYFGQDSGELKDNIDAFTAPSNVATALFIVWCANADFVEFSQTNSPPYDNSDKPAWTAFIDASIARHKDAINKLYNKGVRTLVMPNAVDISVVPYYNLPASDSNFIRSRAVQFNAAFKTEMKAYAATKTGLTLFLPDTFTFFEDVLANPTNYGLVQHLVNGYNIDALTDLVTPSLNSGPGPKYVFWDNMHPSAKFQTQLANMIQTLIESTPPVVTTQPVSKTINSGATTTLTVAFSGTSPSIQWYRGSAGVTTNPVSGATSATFTTPALTANANYWARGTNELGSDDSNTATITIRIAPTITTQPSPVTVGSGSTATFNVAANGTSPTFQWYRGTAGVTTNPVSGATGTTLTTSALTSSTTYWVRATNAAGTADSNAATATVTTSSPFTLWQNNQFTPGQQADPLVSGPDADPDGDGLTNDQEYTFGLLPLAGNPSPSPTAALSGNQISLTFIAKLATGAGYSGLTRRYTLTSADSLDATAWTPVSGYTDIAGNDQTVTYTANATGPRKFYRLCVRLAP